MEKAKMSPAAIFMHSTIYLMIAVSAVSFFLYYGGKYPAEWLKWVGVVAFMIVYHFWLRIIFGWFAKKIDVDYRAPFFRQRKFERKLYKFLRVKKWKNKVLTYNPELFSVRDRSLEEIAKTTAKVERDHWINEGITLASLGFSLIWGAFPVFLISVIFAACFDGQFIVIQRYNRPRILRLIDSKNRMKKPKNSSSEG